MIDRATVDKIIDAAQIVDVVSEFVTLRKSGVNYKGLCPFHEDRNPSFMVSPTKNICKCFVCGKGGTPAGFLMEHEQISYPEALRWLAKKYNIEIEERELTDEERQQQNDRESMFIVNEWAKNWFHHTLKDDPDGVAIGRQYFRSRGIRDDIVEKFQLGYAPQRRDALSTAAMKAGYKAEYLVKTGLCYTPSPDPSQRGANSEVSTTEGHQQQSSQAHITAAGAGAVRLIDRYRGRVIFPWFNVSGKVVAFGGRVLDSRTKGVAQKYVNSPDSDIYHKERELYGLYQAKKAIAKEDRVFMVEGYTDVIAMHQAGIENVVANSGTALSVYQIKMLHRFTQNITLLYDGDEAGIHAAMRGTDMVLANGMNIKVLLLPDGDDPDSFARKHSTEELRLYIDQHQEDFMRFKSRLTVENVSDPVKRSEGISGIVKSISVIPDPILRSTYLSELASRLGLKEQTLITSMNEFIRKDLEEKQKEKERSEARANSGYATGTTPMPPTPPPDATGSDMPAPVSEPISQPTPQPWVSAGGECETMLIREVIRNGEQVIYDNVETEDGQTISINVAQYIDYDLGQDNITLTSPLYRQVLAEAVAHSGDAGFKAETYFTSHADIAISQLASQLAIDRHQLTGRFVIEPREGALRQRVLHLVMDFRLGILKQRLKEISLALRQALNDAERMRQLMTELKDTQELHNTLARKLGKDVMT